MSKNNNESHNNVLVPKEMIRNNFDDEIRVVGSANHNGSNPQFRGGERVTARIKTVDGDDVVDSIYPVYESPSDAENIIDGTLVVSDGDVVISDVRRVA